MGIAHDGCVRIENWSVVTNPLAESFMAPELHSKCLSGNVYGHPRKPDGRHVRTSAIVGCEGRVVSTMSGNDYLLGAPDAEWLAWMQAKGIAFDADHPVRVIL